MKNLIILAICLRCLTSRLQITFLKLKKIMNNLDLIASYIL